MTAQRLCARCSEPTEATDFVLGEVSRPLSYLVVIPVMVEDYARRCLASIACQKSAAGFDRDKVLVVDNSREGFGQNMVEPYGFRVHRDCFGHNLGVARAWNIAANDVVERRLDYLIICSSLVVFGGYLQTNWIEQLSRHRGVPMVEATGHGWHLIAISGEVLRRVGVFDENFYPAYLEEADFLRRMDLAGVRAAWANVWVNAMSIGSALHAERVKCPWSEKMRYYAEKWGGDLGKERFTVPFNQAETHVSYWPKASVAELAARYNLGPRGFGWW